MVIEEVIERVAHALGMVPEAVREVNFLQPPPLPGGSSTVAGATGATTGPAGTTPTAGKLGVNHTPSEPPLMCTSMGKCLPAHLYTLPQVGRVGARQRGV